MGSDNIIVRENLDEVSFIRPILILLVVLYHSMAIHTGNWEMPDGVTVIPVYKAIGRLSYSFMLESFVFVSGYVWAFQRKKRGNSETFVLLFHKKALRLLIPTVMFGIIYLLLFERNNITLLHLLEGPGHLWFLPMLFECFLISWCILSIKPAIRILIPLLFLIAIFTPSDIPFRMSYTFYYLPFFLLGFYYYGLYDQLKAKLRLNHVFELWMLFLVVYLGMVYCRSYIIDNVHSPILLEGGKKLCMIPYSLCGTIALIVTSIYLIDRIKMPVWYIKLGSLCMGVYVFQQFVLEIVYYHTTIPLLIPNYVLSILGFVMSLVISLILSYLLRSTKLGKKLI